MNPERERVRQAQAQLDSAAHRLDQHSRALGTTARKNNLPMLVGSGLAAGFIAALFPLRAWPRFAANLVRVGSGLASLPIAPALIALASRNFLRKADAETDTRSE